MKKTILLTGIGGPTPKGIARALKLFPKHGEYKIIATDSNRLARGLYNNDYVDKTYLVPKATDKNYWAVIKDIIKKEDIDCAVIQPEIEIEVWSNLAENGTLPCKAMIPDKKIVNAFRNKGTMNSLLESTNYIPKSFVFKQKNKNLSEIEKKIGFPYWIRAAVGSSGLGSLKVENENVNVDAWLSLNKNIKEFTVSEFLPGRNFGCKLLYSEGKMLRAAVGERINYVMSNISPSGITGNTSYGKLVNEDEVVNVARKGVELIFDKYNLKPHGFFTVDLKADSIGNPLITEINVRHVAFTSMFAEAGINLAEDMVLLTLGKEDLIESKGIYNFDENYTFLRDVDSEPLLIKDSDLF